MAGVPFNSLISEKPTPKLSAGVAFDADLRKRFDGLKAGAPKGKTMTDLQFALGLHQHKYNSVPLTDFLTRLGFDRGDALYETRADGDPYGTYLRSALATPGTGETAEDAAKRQGGSLPVRRAGTHEGAARAALQGATFGFGDELVAAGAAALDPLVHGDDGSTFPERFAARQAKESDLIENFREDDPATAFAAEIAGAVPTSIATAAPVLNAVKGGTPFAKTAAGVLTSAAQGGAYGAGSTDGDLAERAKGAAAGAAMGVAADAGLAGLNKITQGIWRQFGQRAATKAAIEAAPDAAALKQQSQASYRAAENSGAQLIPQATSSLSGWMKRYAASKGAILPNGDWTDGFGRIRGALKMLDTFAQTPMNMTHFQRFHELLARAAQSDKGGQRALATDLLDKLDDFIERVPQQAWTGGNGPDAAASWLAGKSDWARFKRTKSIEDAFFNARNTPGGDLATNLRTQVASILKQHNKRSRGFSDAEVAAMEQFVQGSPLSQLMSAFNKGGGIPLGVWGGAAAGGPAGAAAGYVAGGAANLAGQLRSNAQAKRALDELLAEVATPGGIPQFAGSVPNLGAVRPAAQGAIGATSGDARDWLRNLMFSEGR